MKIVFVGYMASGKSAIAKIVSTQLSLKLIDLDDYIEEKEGKVISRIFKDSGEIYYRKKEQEYLNEILSLEASFVLSVGGGTPCFSGNIDLILDKSTSFYLQANVKTIYNRLLSEKSKRPLVAEIKDENLQEFIAKHLFERAAFYDQSNHVISVNEKSVNEIATEILEKLA
jgi:shikimate kinase